MFSHAGVLCVVCQCLCCSTSVYAMISSQQHTEWIISIDPQLWTNITFQYRFCQGKQSNICVVSVQLLLGTFDYINSGNWKNWRFIVLRQQQWKPETVWSVSVCISVSMSWEISVLQPHLHHHFGRSLVIAGWSSLWNLSLTKFQQCYLYDVSILICGLELRAN